MKNFILTIFGLFASFALVAQSEFDVRFNLSGVDCDTRIACYDVQVRSTSGTSFSLAGQNYRIYFDNSTADYVSGSSLLPSVAFTNYTVVQDVGPVDATGFSTSLGFEATLGFLNYFIDLNDVDNGGDITIPANGNWLTTSNLCFSVEQSVIDNVDECIELVWAKENYTDDLATAFVEVSEWVGAQDTDPVDPTTTSTHDNLDSSDGDQACFEESCSTPVVADVTISDVTVNEDAGTASVMICQSVALANDVDIVLSTVNNSAISPNDFIALTGQTVTILSGQTCATVSITIVDDSDVESPESFNVLIDSVSEGNITDGIGIVSITDNDVAPPPCSAQAPSISLN